MTLRSRFDDLPPEARNLRLGSLLREHRLRGGLTMADVERRTGGAVKAAALSAYERGMRPVPANRLPVLAELYGSTPDALLARVEPPTPTGVVIDVVALERAPDQAPLLAVVRDLLRKRREPAGRLVGIRSSDLLSEGEDVTVVLDALRERGILVQPS